MASATGVEIDGLNEVDGPGVRAPDPSVFVKGIRGVLAATSSDDCTSTQFAAD